MAFNCRQFKDLIVRPALSAIGMMSDDAIELLLLTCATESQFGRYIRQPNMSGNNGAYGVYQMESRTYNGLWSNLVSSNSAMKAKIRIYCGYEGMPPVQRLISDLALATIMTRLFYLNVKANLPSRSDVRAMAMYWKAHYNTERGSGNVDKAVEDYKNYCSI